MNLTHAYIYHGSVVPAIIIRRRFKKSVKMNCCPSVKWPLIAVQHSVWVCLMCQVSSQLILSVSPCYYRRDTSGSRICITKVAPSSTVIALRAICFTTKNLCIFLTSCIYEFLMNLRLNSGRSSEQSTELST